MPFYTLTTTRSFQNPLIKEYTLNHIWVPILLSGTFLNLRVVGVSGYPKPKRLVILSLGFSGLVQGVLHEGGGV